MEFRVLGTLEFRTDERDVELNAPRLRTLLAVLACHANQFVSAGLLSGALWADRAPKSPANALQVLVHRLRNAIGDAGRIRLGPAGYLLVVLPGELDSDRFEQLVDRARSSSSPGEARELLREALRLWRGTPLSDLDIPAVRNRIDEWCELRLAALEECVDIELTLGRHVELTRELPALVSENPVRERLRAQLMTALYRSRRQADALEVFDAGRRLLADELGVDPGAELRRLHAAILRVDPALDLPVRRPSPVPQQLPADIAGFTGRADALKQLDAQLPGNNAVVISAIAGTPGVGKTALAIRWAHQVADQFPDGHLYVNLRGYAPSAPMRPIEALARFLRALGVEPEEVPADVEEAAASYRTLLYGRRMLVVLDNVSSVEQVRPLLPGAPRCLVLITSRNRLSGLIAKEGVRRLTLDVLTEAEACALLGGTLGYERVDTEPEATAELARLCGLLPLALRVAAAVLMDHPDRTVADYARELETGNRLTALEVDGDEHAAVRAAFDMSYATLPEETRRLFRLLSLVPVVHVTADIAAALADTTPRHAVRLLGRLAGACLIDEHLPGRYASHDLLRIYARDRAESEDTPLERERAVRRLHNHLLSTADAAATMLYGQMLRLPVPPDLPPPVAFEDHSQASAWLEAEHANLVAVIRHAAEHGPRTEAWLLADTLRGYFALCADTTEWLIVAGAGLAAAERDDDVLAQAAAQLSLADARMYQSQYTQAVRHYEKALDLYGQTGCLEGEAAVLSNLGIVYRELGQLQKAMQNFSDSLVLNRQVGRRPTEATCLDNLGAVYWELGRLHEAADHHTQALAIYRETGSRYGEAITSGNLGEVCHALGELDLAREHLERGLTIDREIGSRNSEASTLHRLAAVHLDAGDHAAALDLAETALTLSRDTANRHDESWALNTLATIHRRLARHEQAATCSRLALAIARETGDRYPEADALIGLSYLRDAARRQQDATNCAAEALMISRDSGYRVLEGQALTRLAELHLHCGRYDEARTTAEQALALHRETGHRPGESRTVVILQRLSAPDESQ